MSRGVSLFGLCFVMVCLIVASSAGAGVSSAAAPTPASTVLVGAGSTFDAPFFGRAFSAYHRMNKAVSINYAAVGSSAGIARFQAATVNFGASDVPMTGPEQSAAQDGPSVQIPVDLGAEVVIYNVPGVGSGLHLTGSLIAQIFQGKVRNWDAPAIASLNPGLELPDEGIIVVHRSDGSGTTYIFSDYLSSVDRAWASTLGVGRSIDWPVGFGGNGNAGVAALVARLAGSIGYVERSYSSPRLFGYAVVKNAAGRFVKPSSVNIAAAAAHKPDVTATNFSIVNEPGSNSYPIVGYSWALVYQHQSNTATGTALVNLLEWLTHAGQVFAARTGYVPLPSNIRALAGSTLHTILGPSGGTLLSS